MDQRSDISGADPLDQTETDTPILESETVYQGVTVAPVYEGDAYASEFGDSGTIDYDDTEDNPDLEAQRQRIEQTRAQMGNTIDAIEERLSPSRLAQDAKSAVKDATVGKAQQMASDVTDTASDVGNSIVDTIRENPIPAALAGIGIGWLFMSMRSGNNNSSRDAQRYRYYGHNMYPTQHAYGAQGNYGESDGGVMSSVQGAASSAADTAQSAAGQVAGTVQDTASQVTDTIGNVAGNAADSLGQMGSQAQYGFYQAENQLERLMRERPLAVAAGTFALGMAVGLAIPETQVEDEVFGEYRQDLAQQAQQVASTTAQKVSNVAEQTVSAAKDAAGNAASQEGLTSSPSSSSSKSSSPKSSSSSSTKSSSSSK